MPKKSTSQSPLPENWKHAPGWRNETAFGFAGGLGADGQPVDLVRLSEVVQWWQKAKGLPRSEVIAAMAKALPDDVMGWLYKLKPNEQAALVGEGATFGQPTATSIQTSRAQLQQDMRQLEYEGKSTSHIKDQLLALSKVKPVEPGCDALTRYLGKFEKAGPKRNSSGAMVDALDHLPNQVAYLAIPHAKAYELFDWGERGSVEAAESKNKANANAEADASPKARAKQKVSLDWKSDETKTAFLGAFEKADGKNQTQKLKSLANSGDWGLGFDRLKQLYKSISEEKKNITSQSSKAVNCVWDIAKK